MSFHDWLYSNYSGSELAINSRYGFLHFLVILLCIGICVGVAFLRKKDEKTRRIVLFIMASIILVFEITRRIINLSRGSLGGIDGVLYTLLPRPWCAISCWCFMASTIVNKRFFYNFSSMISLLCAIVFFAHPNVGFDGGEFLFENLYSVATHSLLLVSSITLITLRFADFSYTKEPKSIKNSAIWELVSILGVYIYAFFEAFILKIEKDPLYFRPENDVQDVLGTSYGVYLLIYVLFLIFYFNAFYLVQMLVKHLFAKHQERRREKETQSTSCAET